MSVALVGRLIGPRRHRARSMHAPCKGFSWAVFGPSPPGFSRPFTNNSGPILNDFRYAASGFTADESLEELGSSLILPDESKIRG